jgi:hypothetical protein
MVTPLEGTIQPNLRIGVAVTDVQIDQHLRQHTQRPYQDNIQLSSFMNATATNRFETGIQSNELKYN